MTKNQCSCGNEKCGESHICRKCFLASRNPRFVHGHNGASGKSPTYNSWDMMRQRCNNPKYSQYQDYGGRGIKVCERWAIFQNFLQDMGERPTGKTLDRKDTNGNYAPDNCQWATKQQQVRNTRRNVWIEYDGQRLILSDWAKKLGFTPPGLRYRYLAGLWP
jgi:hypothetical protein